MSQQNLNLNGYVKNKKLPLSPLLEKAKSRKPLILKSCSPDNCDATPSFILSSPTPSLRWRSKPSIKNCYHDTLENPGPSATTNMFDTSAIDEISSHRYDRLRTSLHSTILPAVIPKGSTVMKHPHKLIITSKSVSTKPNKQIVAQNITTCSKSRYWIPTPTEMAKIGDKIPKVFVHTSYTGRKTVAVPIDTRAWLRGNLTPIKSATSATDNQVNLERGGGLLNKKLRRKLKKRQQPPPPPPSPPPHGPEAKKPSKSSKLGSPVATPKKIAKASKNKSPLGVAQKTAKSSKNNSPADAKQKPAKPLQNDLPPKPAAHLRAKKPENNFKLHTVYVNPASKVRLNRGESCSTCSLPPPYTPTESREARSNKEILPASVSLGFGAFVKCFYCHVRFPIEVLREHQDECCKETLKKRDLEAMTSQDFVDVHFENSFHKLNFDVSSCCLLPRDKPIFIDEGGKLAALPAKVSSNDALNQTCWYCGWDYNQDMVERHKADCAAVGGSHLPTSEAKRLRRLVEKRMKTYGRLHPKKKKDLLWFQDA